MRSTEVVGFGIAASIFTLTACGKSPPEVVWEGQTKRSEDRVIECLKRTDQFEGDWIRVSAASGFVVVRPDYPGATYVVKDEMLLSFSEYRGEIDRIRIRAPRKLTAQEGEVLSRCAPFPSLLAEPIKRSSRTE